MKNSNKKIKLSPNSKEDKITINYTNKNLEVQEQASSSKISDNISNDITDEHYLTKNEIMKYKLFEEENENTQNITQSNI